MSGAGLAFPGGLAGYPALGQRGGLPGGAAGCRPGLLVPMGLKVAL